MRVFPMAKERKCKVCPNCGRILSSRDFLSDYFYLGFESVLQRFRCINCNYRGLPIEMLEKDYPKIEFPNNRF